MNANFDIISKFKKLKVLNLSHSDINDEALKKLADNCKDLEELMLLWCSEITDAGIRHLLRLENLRSFRFYDRNGQITDNSISMLQNLEILHCGCPGVKDTGVIALIKRGKKLKKLELFGSFTTKQTLIKAKKWKEEHPEEIKLEIVVTFLSWGEDCLKKSPNLIIRELSSEKGQSIVIPYPMSIVENHVSGMTSADFIAKFL